MDVIIVGFYTRNTLYEDHVKNLIASLKLYDLPYKIVPIDNKGSWHKNMQYKPTFLKNILMELDPSPLVYVDADAVFCQYPQLFNELPTIPNVSLAAHILDHNLYRRKGTPSELLSGTVYLKNDKMCKEMVDEWIKECKVDERLWDQVGLQRVVEKNKGRFYELPGEYCCIHDYMADRITSPVIQHFQASRVFRHGGGDINRPGRHHVRNRISDAPRVVTQNGVLKIRRIH